MKTCIIYCPNYRPLRSQAKRRALIENMLHECGIEYDFVQSEHKNSVERLVNMMINNGYDNIIICGGDGALNSAVNCIMKQEKSVRQRIALGVIPNGTMNDFAAFWGLNYHNVRDAINVVARHKKRLIDLGCIKYNDSIGNEQRRYFINCLNIGLLAKIQTMKSKTRRKLWSRELSFAVSMILMIFQRMENRMRYTINGNTENHRVMTMCIGNALGYGQTPSAVPYSGMLDIMIVRHSKLSQFIGAMWLFIRGKIFNHRRVRPYRTDQPIIIDSEKTLPISIDGHEAESPRGEFTVTIEQEEINFLV